MSCSVFLKICSMARFEITALTNMFLMVVQIWFSFDLEVWFFGRSKESYHKKRNNLNANFEEE